MYLGLHRAHFVFVAAFILALGIAASLTSSAQTPTLQTQAEVPQVSLVLEHWHESGHATTLATYLPARQAKPASLTKLLTAYAVLEAANKGVFSLADQITVSLECARIEGTRVGYRPQERVSISDALQGMLAISGNDAACALGGLWPNTAAHLNSVSNGLGTKNSHWLNPHGLDEAGHLSSAQDVLRIARALWRDFPLARPWLGRKQYVWHGLTQANRNALLHADPTVDGLKTGHTQAAGYNLAVSQTWPVVIDGDRYDWRLSAVVLGADSAAQRAKALAQLLAWGRAYFQMWRFYAAGDLAGHWHLPGVADKQALYWGRSVWGMLAKGQDPAQLTWMFMPSPNLQAPYAAGQTVGTVIGLNSTQWVAGETVTLREAQAASPWYAMAWAWVKWAVDAAF